MRPNLSTPTALTWGAPTRLNLSVFPAESASAKHATKDPCPRLKDSCQSTPTFVASYPTPSNKRFGRQGHPPPDLALTLRCLCGGGATKCLGLRACLWCHPPREDNI